MSAHRRIAPVQHIAVVKFAVAVDDESQLVFHGRDLLSNSLSRLRRVDPERNGIDSDDASDCKKEDCDGHVRLPDRVPGAPRSHLSRILPCEPRSAAALSAKLTTSPGVWL